MKRRGGNSRSSFLIKESISILERCECHNRSPQAAQQPHLILLELATKVPTRSSLSDALEGGTNPSNDVDALSTAWMLPTSDH